ncbi:hypothetical protein E2C01_053401 [Portunus trituberculatus]|uniref:Uncharacterized protein n=1 Tax=Portunus trituberculatus TaxID=210409 RepID=A0A5B7GK81_PORTR|nr:hypothetical protein [Portunus trituberculatus]
MKRDSNKLFLSATNALRFLPSHASQDSSTKRFHCNLYMRKRRWRYQEITFPNPDSEFPSGEGTRNVPRLDSSLNNNPKCLDTSLNFFFINFCNIHGLRSNFQSVEHHFSSTKPPHLFLTETQLSEANDSSPFFSVPSYFLYSHFHSKAGCCIYVRNNFTCSRAHTLEPSEFSTICL